MEEDTEPSRMEHVCSLLRWDFWRQNEPLLRLCRVRPREFLKQDRSFSLLELFENVFADILFDQI